MQLLFLLCWLLYRTLSIAKHNIHKLTNIFFLVLSFGPIGASKGYLNGNPLEVQRLAALKRKQLSAGEGL